MSIKDRSYPKPFDTIALCFSGGGFRAASFGLGTLSYFNEIKLGENSNPNLDSLLSKVTYLASASGGTITTALYSKYNVEGKLFDEYYKFLFDVLSEQDILNEAVALLNDDTVWSRGIDKRRNMINAFALAYDKLLFEGKSIAHLKIKGSQTHLEEVCFNTTEFYRGLLFRQNVALRDVPHVRRTTFLFGNHVLNLDHEAAERLKLGDVLAASSCFPGGFEPISFPNDFAHGEDCNKKYLMDHLQISLQTGGLDELKFLFGEKPVEILQQYRDILLHDGDRSKLLYKPELQLGFMDGGITDNLGLDSMMKANERRTKKFDLMMTNDVGTIFMDPFNTPEASTSRIGELTVNSSIKIASTLSIVGFILLIISAITKCHIATFIVAIIGTLVMCCGVLIFLLLFLAAKLINDATNKSSGLNLEKNFDQRLVSSLLGDLKSTTLNVLLQMVKARSTSMLILNTDVFLKRIRKLLYNNFFETYAGLFRAKSNSIYDLTYSNDINRGKPRVNGLTLTPALQNVAEVAYGMGTTLWFDLKNNDPYHKRACLIACGQFTTCYNLIEYIEMLKGPNMNGSFPEPYQKRIATIKTQLWEHYKRFQEDPFFLYNQVGLRSGIESFESVNIKDIPTPKNFAGLYQN